MDVQLVGAAVEGEEKSEPRRGPPSLEAPPPHQMCSLSSFLFFVEWPETAATQADVRGCKAKSEYDSVMLGGFFFFFLLPGFVKVFEILKTDVRHGASEG